MDGYTLTHVTHACRITAKFRMSKDIYVLNILRNEFKRFSLRMFMKADFKLFIKKLIMNRESKGEVVKYWCFTQ